MDEYQHYKAEAKRLIRRRYTILHNAIGYPSSFDENSVGYYKIIDLEELSQKLHGAKFSKWLMTNYTGAEFIMHLADETGVVLLPGKGFDVDHPSARVSLANLTENDYRAIGQSVRKIMEEFKKEFSSK